MSEIWLKAKDVANRLGVSSSWVLRKARCRVGPDMAIIPHFRIGGVIRFSERQIEEWVKEHGIKGALKV